MKLPVGYFKFHRNGFINYQMNRWHSLGYAKKQHLVEIGKNVKTFSDYVSAFSLASDQALTRGELKYASTYCRASEFLISPDDPSKIETYDRFIALFDRAFSDDGFERHQVPYNQGALSCIRLASRTGEVRGTIICCGGFDSFIEEFYGIWAFFAECGYDVIAFEGPGQGGTRRKNGLTFDHDWEKPTAAVLDFFDVEDVTALGISMGGYWVMRAAAFEKRISRVVAMPPVYDWLEMTNSLNQKLAKWLLTKPKILNFFVRLKMSVGTLRHTINNALFIQDKQEPIDAVEWMMGMNKEHLHSDLITQDVLLLSGENDAFQPTILAQKQKAALVNARSVSERVFLKSEHGDQHCQIGNVGLALRVIADWLETMERK